MEQPLPLLQRREGAVLVLSNNNPAARNALSPAFYAALTEALAQADRLQGEHRELQMAAEQVQRQISIDERDYLHMFEEGTVGAEIEAEEDGRKPEAQLLAQIKQRKEFYL